MYRPVATQGYCPAAAKQHGVVQTATVCASSLTFGVPDSTSRKLRGATVKECRLGATTYNQLLIVTAAPLQSHRRNYNHEETRSEYFRKRDNGQFKIYDGQTMYRLREEHVA